MTMDQPDRGPRRQGNCAGWVCLFIAWIMILIPLSTLIVFVWGPLVLAALIISIIALARREGGLGLFLTTLIGTPIVYFIGSLWLVVIP